MSKQSVPLKKEGLKKLNKAQFFMDQLLIFTPIFLESKVQSISITVMEQDQLIMETLVEDLFLLMLLIIILIYKSPLHVLELVKVGLMWVLICRSSRHGC